MQLDPLQPFIPEIFRGEDLSLPVTLPNDQFSGDPVDLTSATEIEAVLVNADGASYVTKKLSLSGITLVRAAIGRFEINFLVADTSGLALSAAPGDIGLRISWVIAGKTSIVNLNNFCTITERLFPSAP